MNRPVNCSLQTSRYSVRLCVQGTDENKPSSRTHNSNVYCICARWNMLHVAVDNEHTNDPYLFLAESHRAQRLRLS